MKKVDKETLDFFNGYYTAEIVDCTDIIYDGICDSLKKIHDKYGKSIEMSDCYRAISYSALKMLTTTTGTDISKEKNLNKTASEIVEKIIDKYKDVENGKTFAFSVPCIMMDALAFKEYQYNYVEEVDENEL